MARDQFQRVQPGQQLPGLPSQPWNQMVDGLKAQGIGARGPGDGLESAVEVLVVNGTAAPVIRCGVLRVNAPFVTPAQDLNQFIERDALRGVTPAANQPFVILREPVSAGAVAWARILGLARCQVRVNDASHGFAGPGTSTDYLESMVSGPAQILWVDPTCAGSGGTMGSARLCWADVLLGGGTGGGDVMDLAELNNSGVTPPAGWLDARTLTPDVPTKTLTVKENIWLWEAT